MSMTSVCFGIAKVQCQMLNIIGYFFSISYMPMHDLFKKKICKENKSKKNQNALNMIASMSRRCESYRMYLKCDSPHQVVMIVCELFLSSYLSSFQAFSYRNLDTSSTPGGSIEKVLVSSIASRHLVDQSSLISCV